jgi:pimeloyl-ACP methyl ester carboxylesterase
MKIITVIQDPDIPASPISDKGRGEYKQFVEAAATGILAADPESLIQALHSLLSPVDVAVLSKDIATYLLNNMREGIKEKRDGWVDDDIVFTTPWGFELDQIRIPVIIIHGKQDRFVPFSHGEWLGGHIPGVDTRFLADDGHITLAVRRVLEAHSWLLGKMQ